jgi:hypothetical protein
MLRLVTEAPEAVPAFRPTLYGVVLVQVTETVEVAADAAVGVYVPNPRGVVVTVQVA